ncbi:MAG TPA: hypothetical protein VMQ81_00980 [Acidimicrobiia bacterium]|nr:hypothetical protein [Acidimicrobiia bacterium]
MLMVRRLVVALAFVGSAACNTAGDGTAASDTADQGAPVGTASCLDHSSEVRRHTPAGSAAVFLVDARVSKLDDCVDQVTFEFRSDGRPLPPGYSVEYEEGPFIDFTSGDEFEPAGEAYLVLRFAKTAVFAPGLPGAPAEPTYTGRESIVPSGMNHLQEARIIQAGEGDEGVIMWVIGLDSKRPFNVDGSSLALLPPPDSTTTTTTSPSPSGSSTSSTTTTTTTTPTAATARIVVRIG